MAPPTIYPIEKMREIFDSICETMADGKSCRRACIEHDVKPTTFLHWLRNHFNSPEDVQQYERAREMMVEAVVDESFDIADAEPKMYQIGESSSIDRGDIEQMKLRAGLRQWYAGKISKRYSEKAHEVESKPSDFGSITVNIIKDERPQD